jgi:hypothetical protein
MSPNGDFNETGYAGPGMMKAKSKWCRAVRALGGVESVEANLDLSSRPARLLDTSIKNPPFSMLFMDEVAEKIYFGQDSQNDSHYHKYLGMCPPKKRWTYWFNPWNMYIILYPNGPMGLHAHTINMPKTQMVQIVSLSTSLNHWLLWKRVIMISCLEYPTLATHFPLQLTSRKFIYHFQSYLPATIVIKNPPSVDQNM